MKAEDSRLALTAIVCLLAGGVLGRVFFPQDRPPQDPPAKPIDVASLLPNPLKSENEILRNRLTLASASKFERDNQLLSRFDNCEDMAGGLRCTAKNEAGVLITYHCDPDRCIMECSK